MNKIQIKPAMFAFELCNKAVLNHAKNSDNVEEPVGISMDKTVLDAANIAANKK